MGLVFNDWTMARDDLVDAIQSHKEHRDDARTERELLDAAKRVPELSAEPYTEQVMKMIKLGNPDRALRMVSCFGSLEEPALTIRWWIKIPLLIIAWPFRVIYRIIKMGMP